jgi:beta-phosphoglucomutase-like phosphatase (HAD superfamily)
MTDISKFEAVIFDVDGTLYEQRRLRRAVMMRFAGVYWSHPILGSRAARVIKAYRKAYEELRGQPYSTQKQLDLAASKTGIPGSQVREIVGRWIETEPLELFASCVYPGVIDLLKKLAERRIPCGVFSDYPAQKKVEAMRLSHFFQNVGCADEVGWLKPDPRGLLAVAKCMGVAPDGALYIGDRQVDQDAAIQAGMKSILVRNAKDYSDLLRNFSQHSKT